MKRFRPLLPGLLLATCLGQQSPEGQATVSGLVTDSTGALIPEAEVTLVPDGASAAERSPLTDVTDRTGSFRFHPSPGSYRLRVDGLGFAAFTSPPFQVTAGAHLAIPVRLAIAPLEQQLTVPDVDDGTEPSGPGGAMTFEGESLKLLSNDQATLAQQLTALAGGSGRGSLLVDGFSGAKLPPKTAIRSIAINRNSFSAYFPDYGAGRVEVTTQPGADALHGELDLGGTNQPWNARNPYTTVKPPFFDFQESGSLSGPIGKKASFFVSETVDDLANSSVVNAADPAAPSTLISTYAVSPQHQQTYSGRVSFQFSQHNFGHIRDEWNRTTVQNSGIVPLLLPQAAFSSDLLGNALQLSDTQILGSHAVNETRFQYQRTRNRQLPNSAAPSVVVQGSFQAGGSPAQLLRDSQDRYELQDRFEMDAGHHALRGGLRWVALRDASVSTAGFNGQYIFADADSYLAGRAQQYSLTVGRPDATLVDHEVDVYAEDDWKLTPDFTLSYGARMESQTAIPDHTDPAPRIAFAWAVKPGRRKTSLFTLRAGYGLFYNRFPAVQLLQSIRQDGTREIASVAKDVAFNPNGPPAGVNLTAAQPTVYQLDPRLRTMYMQVGSVSLQRSLGRLGAVNVTGVYAHNVHDYLTRNANAPLPGTYSPSVPGSGVRPLGNDRNVYQFASVSNANLESVSFTYRLRLPAHLFAYGFAHADKNLTESEGVDQFAAHPYEIRRDYGRSSADQARFLAGGLDWTLPHGFQLSGFLSTRSGLPFDITTGTDLNGDTIYNDRPGPGSASSGAGALVSTGYGTFDVAPGSGAAEIARNFATAPAFFWTQLRASEVFHLGPRPAPATAANGAATPAAERPWTLSVAVEVHNVGNRNNPGVPVGALSAQPCGAAIGGSCACGLPSCTALLPSAYFGRSLSLATDLAPASASNRVILLQSSFSF